MDRKTMLALAGALWLVAAVPAGAQVVTLKGVMGESKIVSAQAFAAMPHATVTASEHGRSAAYDGVPLSALTALVGAPQGEALRGPAMADIVVVTAADGYRVALSLAETDPAVRADRIILADRADGHPLDAREGPYRLVVEGDKRPARSARNVQSIEVRAAP